MSIFTDIRFSKDPPPYQCLAEWQRRITSLEAQLQLAVGELRPHPLFRLPGAEFLNEILFGRTERQTGHWYGKSIFEMVDFERETP